MFAEWFMIVSTWIVSIAGIFLAAGIAGAIVVWGSSKILHATSEFWWVATYGAYRTRHPREAKRLLRTAIEQYEETDKDKNMYEKKKTKEIPSYP